MTAAHAPDVNPPLHSQRLRIEPMVQAHAETLFAAIADPALYTWIDDGPPASVAALRERCRRLETRHSADGEETWLNWTLFLPDQPQALGYVQASLLADGRAWVAYLLAQSAWGQGYASEAVAAMLQHLFGALGARQAMAVAERDNSRSLALLQRLGFTLAAGDALRDHTLTATEVLFLLAPGQARPPGPCPA